MTNTQKIIILFGLLILVVGINWPWISKLPFGKLPGDIIIDKPNFKMFIPITSMIVLSLIISFLIWLVRKF